MSQLVLPEREHLAMNGASRPGRASRVAIIGAGPYGLAVAAHLRAAGVEARMFGEVMSFWHRRMPIGMLLRSSWDASHISDPHRRLTLDAYQEAVGHSVSKPIPLDRFVDYGRWFQRQVVPDLDQRRVSRVDVESDGFRLITEDGEALRFERVVVATGIAPFASRPLQFDGLPPSLASHTSEHCDLGRFAGQRVVVVGGGQSALESAALLGEAGADVEVVVRAPSVRWLRRSGALHKLGGPIRGLLYPPTDVGPPGLNQLVARPDLFRRLPRWLQDRIAYRSIRPAAAGWLVPRVDAERITTGRAVRSAIPAGAHVLLMLDDGTTRRVDHVLLATGYRVNVAGYGFLAPELVRSMRLAGGYPQLRVGLEASVRGLHFVGASAAWSFGPLMRFVSGTDYAARAIVRSVVGVPA